MELMFETFLLVVKECRPGKDIATVKVNELVRLWAGHVLQEYRGIGVTCWEL